MKELVKQLLEHKIYRSGREVSRAMGMAPPYVHICSAKNLCPSYRALMNLADDLRTKEQNQYAEEIMTMIMTDSITAL